MVPGTSQGPEFEVATRGWSQRGLGRDRCHGPELFQASWRGTWTCPRLAGCRLIDRQRSCCLEQIVQGDNFGADVLSIRWTKNF